MAWLELMLEEQQDMVGGGGRGIGAGGALGADSSDLTGAPSSFYLRGKRGEAARNFHKMFMMQRM